MVGEDSQEDFYEEVSKRKLMNWFLVLRVLEP